MKRTHELNRNELRQIGGGIGITVEVDAHPQDNLETPVKPVLTITLLPFFRTHFHIGWEYEPFTAE
jgi:hypothetical protein